MLTLACENKCFPTPIPVRIRGKRIPPSKLPELTNMLKIISFIKIVSIICFSSTALSANWIKAGEAIYIDGDSIKKNHGSVSYSSLRNMTTMGLNSIIVLNKANCDEGKVTELNIYYYGQPMGQGELVEKKVANKRKQLMPNTNEYAAMKFACELAE